MSQNIVKWKMHPAGWFVLAASFLFADSSSVLASILALTLHEAAHVIAMRFCGMKHCTIELTPFGGMADVKAFDSYPPWKRIVSSFVGIAASVSAACITLKTAAHTPFAYAFFESNASLALMNVLPAWPLDGARVIAGIACLFGKERAVKRVLSILSYVLGAGMVVLGLIGIWMGVLNVSLLLVGPYLCYAARWENVSGCVRNVSNFQNKLKKNNLMGIQWWVSDKEPNTEICGKLLGRSEPTKYSMLAHICADTGRVVNCLTEEDIYRVALGMEAIDGEKT